MSRPPTECFADHYLEGTEGRVLIACAHLGDRHAAAYRLLVPVATVTRLVIRREGRAEEYGDSLLLVDAEDVEVVYAIDGVEFGVARPLQAGQTPVGAVREAIANPPPPFPPLTDPEDWGL